MAYHLSVRDAIPEALRSSGEPLDAVNRAYFEPRFGYDLSRVRVHTDAAAARSASDESAAAYTVGPDIVFGKGRYSPQTAPGRRLLAHELVHVLQQTGAAPGERLSRDDASSAAETEARRLAEVGDTATGPLAAPTALSGGVCLQRAPEDESKTADDDKVSTPGHMARSVVWFQFNSDRPREDSEVSSTTHLAIALRRIGEHAVVAGAEQVITLHGYASREGTEALNFALSQSRAERVRGLLVDASVPGERIVSVGHGPDASLPGRKWNRRVEIDLTPSVTQIDFSEDAGAEVSGVVPRTGPLPLESTKNVLTPRHWTLRKRPRLAAEAIHGWDESDLAAMQWERAREGKSQTLLDYKDSWVHAHRTIIKAAAAENALPDWFVAGVAWAELGGDPSSVDYLAHSYRRDIGIGGKPPEETSFGAVSIQIRRAAEELGYDPARLTKMQASFIISSLADPQQNLFIVASHLDRVRDRDFPGKPAELLTDDDLKIIGTRYNRGPDISLERIKQNLSHGESVVKKKERLEGLLAD